MLTLIVAIPKSAVEDGEQLLVPGTLLLIGECAVEHRKNSLVVGLNNSVDIFRSARPTLNLKHSDTSIHHDVHETYGLQVLRRHDVLIVNIKFRARLQVCHLIAPSTYLHTLTTVGTTVGIVKAQIALATNSHTQSTMTEHLYPDKFAMRTTHILFHYLLIYITNLPHVEFTCKHNNISKLGIKLQSLNIGNVQLGGKMNLLPHLTAICHNRHIGSNHSRDVGLLSSIDNLTHSGKILAIDNSVDRKITLKPVLMAYTSNILQVFYTEIIGRMRTHVQFANAKIY